MKSVPLVLVLLVLLVSTAVDGRPLRSSTTTKHNAGIKPGGADDAARVPTLAVSANNSRSTGHLFRSLVYKLASGPSKKGPGH
ncbi:hypothetical protein V6N13_039947 [Hibiscus sabdariffa]|uniref:Uncharacterized protein n=1 Tax=Hibiscus sabdariffa TaxID=183260 RepID=A0ABR2STW5_9ROSI